MKNLIRIIAVLLIAAISVSFCACQLSNYIENETDTETESGSSTSAAPETDEPETEYKPLDLMNMDLSQFLTLGDYSSFKLETYSEELTDEEFEEAKMELLESCATKKKVIDRATAKGDLLNIAFEGYMDGKLFSGGSSTSSEISLTENTGYIDGFDKDLYGIMPGTKVETEVTFPENYHNAKLAGKDAVFKITVNYIIETELPEYNDEFVSEYSDGKYTTVETFEEYYREQFTLQKKAAIEEYNREIAWEALVKASTVKSVPQGQIDYYYNSDREYYEDYAAFYGMTYDQFLQYLGTTDEELKENAYENALNDLVLYAFIKKENVTINDEEYDEALKKFAEENSLTVSYVEYIYTKEQLEELFLYEKVRNILVSLSEFTVVEPEAETGKTE